MPRSSNDNRPPVLAAADEPEWVDTAILRIAVPLPFALRSANIYLIADGPRDWTLVDAGLGLADDKSALLAGLSVAGIGLEDITGIILTHCHPDHIGLSGPIQAASGAPVYMLSGEERTMYRVWGQQAETANGALSAMYVAHGMTLEEVESGLQSPNHTRSAIKLPPPECIVPVEDGATLRLGDHSYQIIWTPGHSDYHMCLLRDDAIFIAGDHVLPSITPNIGWYPGARPNPLDDYFIGLRKVRDLTVRLVLPGHRQVLTQLAPRVDELRTHHLERSEAIYSLLDSAAPLGLSAASVAHSLFGERLRTADDLRFAVAESLAHLEFLRSKGRASRVDRDGHILYMASETTELIRNMTC